MGLLHAENNLLGKGSFEEVEVVAPPDPSRLRPNWWTYFQVDPERLIVRAQKVLELLDHQELEMSQAQLQSGRPLLAQIRAGLQTYLEMLKTKNVLPPLEKAVFQESYTFEAFLKLGRTLTQEESRLSTLELKEKLDQTNIRSDSAHLDTATADYLSLSSKSPQKIIKGLAIMATKINLAIDLLKLKALQTQVERKKEEIANLEEEILFSREHIDTADIAFPHLEKAVDLAQLNYYAAQEKLLHVQTAQINHHLDFLHHQTVFNRLLERSFREMQWVQARLNYILAKILARPQREDVQNLYNELESLRKDQESTEKELADWKKGAEYSHKEALFSGIEKNVFLAQQGLTLVQNIEGTLAFNDFLFMQALSFIRAHYTTLKDRLLEYKENALAVYKNYGKWGNRSLFKLGEAPVTFFGLLKVTFTLFIAYLLAKFVKKWIVFLGSKQKRIKQAGTYTLSRLVYYFIIVLGIIIAISSIGIDFTTFAVIAGALSLGIGFGLQSIVNNFVAGVIVLLEKKLRVGDYIQIESGEMGFVMEINVRTTLIKTFDNLEVLVPNADLVAKKFVNWTLSEKTRRIRVPFGVAFGSDKAQVKEVVVQAAKQVPVTDPGKEPQVWLTQIGESSLDFELVVWVNEYIQGIAPMATVPRYMWEIESALVKNAIKIPYPVCDVNLHQTKER